MTACHNSLLCQPKAGKIFRGHSSLTIEKSENLKRVLKSAVKIKLDEQYGEYEDGLVTLNIETLSEMKNNFF